MGETPLPRVFGPRQDGGQGLMAGFVRRGLRGVLIGLEQEPVVVFSIALSALALGVAVVVPPIRRSLDLPMINYDSGPVVKDAAPQETAAEQRLTMQAERD